jgi:DNA-directed RNA polymerase specialized sigma54-like protein
MQSAPMSDRELSEHPSARGFSVSRRTVAEYCSELGIAAAGREASFAKYRWI